IKLVALPRFSKFTDLMKVIAKKDIDLLQIAGHEEILIGVVEKSKTTMDCPEHYCSLVTRFQLPTQKNESNAIYSIHIDQLKGFINSIENNSDLKINHIYDYLSIGKSTKIFPSHNIAMGTKNVDVIKAKLKENSSYYKDIMQTYTTLSQWLLVDIFKEFGKFMEHTPWFDFPFTASEKIFQKINKEINIIASKKTANKTIFKKYTSLNSKLSYAIWSLFREMGGAAWLLIKVTGMNTELIAKTMGVLVKDPKNEIMLVDPRIQLAKEFDNGIKFLQVPRYVPFTEIMKKIALTTSVEVVEIASQSEIAIGVTAKNHTKPYCPEQYCSIVSQYQFPTMPTNTQETIVVIPVGKLNEFFKETSKVEGLSIKRLYDF
ncbi:MAG: hypothetical protein K2X39_08285, partial [Silvanigrellaceae bacterium]|nr:hypothetical protein [Silvanigrellaceae bacterium]